MMAANSYRTACAQCGNPHGKGTGEVNRAIKAGLRLFCNRKCAGLARRKGKTKAQKISEKKAYDKQYRLRDPAALKARKAAYFKRTYDPAKAAKERKVRMPLHVEYCRQPRYKEWKKDYDQKRRDSMYGAFADAARLTLILNREIKSRTTNYEIRIQNQTGNKKQTRSRQGAEGYLRDRHPRAQG